MIALVIILNITLKKTCIHITIRQQLKCQFRYLRFRNKSSINHFSVGKSNFKYEFENDVDKNKTNKNKI